MKVSLGTFPYGDDVHTEVVQGLDSRFQDQPALQPGIKYFYTVDVEDYAGWITRQTSDGFTIDLVRFFMFVYYVFVKPTQSSIWIGLCQNTQK